MYVCMYISMCTVCIKIIKSTETCPSHSCSLCIEGAKLYSILNLKIRVTYKCSLEAYLGDSDVWIRDVFF